MANTKTNGNGNSQGAAPAPKGNLFCCPSFAGKIILTLVGILLVYLVVLFGTMIRNNLQKYNFIGRADRPERTIFVEAQGKVTAKPDIAVTNIGMINEAKTVSEAQQKNTEIMNKLVSKLKELGVEEKDIQTTSYYIYPQYDWDEGRQSLRGYQVSQSVTVKIRNLDKANQVLALAGEVGANQVSGLSFTIDEQEVYKAQAREEALKKINDKVQTLSKALGVRFVSVVSYNEYQDSGYYPVYGSAFSKAEGLGGGGSVPDIQTGSLDVVLNVNVTFEIK